MSRLFALGVGLAGLPLAVVASLALLAAAAFGGGGLVSGGASSEAVADIPAVLLEVYVTEAAGCVGLPWQVVAAIGKVESDHGRFGGGVIQPDGRVVPEIIGIALDGSNGTARILDTDNGELDRDVVFDRAVGPFQFIPTSWALFGRDGNGDALADPHNIFDAVPAAVAHLCPGGVVSDVEAAVFGYNRSQAYVDLVMSWAARYTAATALGGYVFPVPEPYQFEAAAVRSHHDYPAWDVGLPVGTPLFAMTSGTVTTAVGDAGVYRPGGGGRCGNTVTITGFDGAVYTYCHLSTVLVSAGEVVVAGQTVGTSGGVPGTPGAGNTTGPHLHLSIRVDGRLMCPQPMLLGLLRGVVVLPQAAPSSGCFHPGPSTNWPAWLNAAAAASTDS